ncbi:MAG: NAD(+) diphosphatase [Pseudomonadota bacterium]
MILRQPVTFAASPGDYDRAAHLRDLTRDLVGHRHAGLLPLWQGKILVDLRTDNPVLGWIRMEGSYMAELTETPIFLGLQDQAPRFAADFSRMTAEQTLELFGDGAKFIDLRSIAGQLRDVEATLAAVAKGLMGWHLIHPYCARCGQPSVAENGGWRRRCTVCGANHFPRTDPVVIMLILREERALVGRQPEWPEGLYSLLAGFMEPGETIEEAVRRETLEEAGIEVGDVRYLACQPWPFPSSLMLGCIGIAKNDEITRRDQELQDAMWVSRNVMGEILAGVHHKFVSPRADAIARSILTAWVRQEIPGV